MLKYYDEECDILPDEIIKEIDVYFNLHCGGIIVTQAMKDAVAYIDKATLVDSATIISDEGMKISLLDLSSGCKTCLCVILFPDVCFSTLECGPNAMEYIMHLSTGCIYNPAMDMDMNLSDSCDILCEEKHYTTITDVLTR